MKTLIDAAGKFIKDSRQFFAENSSIIADRNLRMLKLVSGLGSVLFAAYFIVTCFIFRSEMLGLIYVFILAAMIALYVFVCRYRGKGMAEYSVVQPLCVFLVSVIMIFTICISVFPFPERPAVFFSILYLALSILFVFPFHKTLLLFTSFEVLYILVAVLFKDDTGVLGYDLFSAITAWVLGGVISFLILDSQIREGKLRKMLETAYSTDTVTGLPNRKLLTSFLEQTFDARKESGGQMAVMLMDIDGFKEYNDTFGHLAGDDCLALIGQALREYTDETQIFGARYGGEEFVFVLDEPNREELSAYAGALVEKIRGLQIPAEYSRFGIVTVSVGAAVRQESDETYLSLLDRSDQALYQAKKKGKNQYVIWDGK
ncbi:GGDEF domain-containing protein [Anaerolentibacter hominis]|uniref:GGDEF domain-containing protein n=1 Tax=Anaerolentibacter hominis TaxID=3079009 RepID=UPI0031B813CB